LLEHPDPLASPALSSDVLDFADEFGGAMAVG
jgi:hypothetical protein